MNEKTDSELAALIRQLVQEVADVTAELEKRGYSVATTRYKDGMTAVDITRTEQVAL